MQEYKTLQAFTLIEMMVVVTLIFIVTFMTYAPYAHHQKKVLLKQWAREISQSLAESRNLAINGFDTGSGNLNIGLFFGSGANSLVYYTSTGAFDRDNLSAADILKEKILPKWIQIDSIDGDSEDFLFFYERISWDVSIFPSTTGEVDISISYKWAISSVLQNNIRYYTKSYISDY